MGVVVVVSEKSALVSDVPEFPCNNLEQLKVVSVLKTSLICSDYLDTELAVCDMP